MPELRESGVDRLLAFSDGVFAIAVTLLVLDLREPTVSHGLLDALLKQWPAYLSYALSFLIVGIIWAQHHWMFQLIRRTDHIFILINVVFLMWVAIVPFPTALLSSYLENRSERQTAVAVYTAVFFVGGLLVNLQWRYAIHRNRLLGAEVDRRAIQKMTLNYAVGPLLYLAGFALSFVSPPASIALIVLINLFFAVSPLLLDRLLS
ncbi:MAG: DUF1211 domain-containing protein [Thermomicrobiales bacterium]|nr:DUF1211 domain-containing protein [Thermomicrobiales bacterium]